MIDTPPEEIAGDTFEMVRMFITGVSALAPTAVSSLSDIVGLHLSVC